MRLLEKLWLSQFFQLALLLNSPHPNPGRADVTAREGPLACGKKSLNKWSRLASSLQWWLASRLITWKGQTICLLKSWEWPDSAVLSLLHVTRLLHTIIALSSDTQWPRKFYIHFWEINGSIDPSSEAHQQPSHWELCQPIGPHQPQYSSISYVYVYFCAVVDSLSQGFHGLCDLYSYLLRIWKCQS